VRPEAEPPAEKPLHFAERAPGARLADVVVRHWTFEARATTGAFVHHIWPDGCISIAIGAPQRGAAPFVGIAGPTRGARRVPVAPGAVYHGVRFWPDAGGAALGVEAESLRERTIPGAAVFGRAVEELADAALSAPDGAARARALDDWLGAHLPSIPRPDPAVRRAVRAIIDSRGERPIADVAAEAGIGARQLQRVFRRAVGLTPKEYARIRRARSSLAALMRGEGSWAGLAADMGYADQSHLIRELGDLTGFTPVALRERLAIIEHSDVVP
jgi:AraC-like DNA-binding protein